MCILLVEDEDLVREVLADGLNSQGFEVCEACSGDHAADLIQNPSRAFSLLITDINMTGQRDGIEVARLMRLRWSSIPIIFITGGSNLNLAGSIGTNEVFLRKPFSLQELTQVARMLNRSQNNRLIFNPSGYADGSVATCSSGRPRTGLPLPAIIVSAASGFLPNGDYHRHE